eukprot:3370046-Pleurochrysis_carterae.AAC.2
MMFDDLVSQSLTVFATLRISCILVLVIRKAISNTARSTHDQRLIKLGKLNFIPMAGTVVTYINILKTRTVDFELLRVDKLSAQGSRLVTCVASLKITVKNHEKPYIA